MISPGVRMPWYLYAVFIAYLALVIWAALDAFEQTDMGCMWLTLFFMVPVLPLIVYICFRSYVRRKMHVPDATDPREYRGHVSHFANEIEKAQYIDAVSQGQGTMYEPSRPGAPRGGFRHFTDSRAETLLSQGLHGEAFEYLAEMYEVAQDERDGRAQDTYMYYIHRLPGGARLLAARQKERRAAGLGPDDGGDDRPAPPSREVPF